MKNFNSVSLKGIVRTGRRTGKLKPVRRAPAMVLQGTSMDLNRNLDIMAQKDLSGFFDNLVEKVSGAASYITRDQQVMQAVAAAAKTPTLKSVAQVGQSIAAVKAPALAKLKLTATAKKGALQSGLDAFNNVFSGAATWVSNAKSTLESTTTKLAPLYSAAQSVAAAVGVKLPSAMESETAALADKVATMRRDAFMAQSYVNQVVNPMLNNRKPETDALAQSISKAISDVQNATSVALTKLSIAQTACDSAKNDIMHGVIPQQALAAFALQSNPAEQAFNAARLKMQALDALVEKARQATTTAPQSIIAQTAQAVYGAGQAAYATGEEVGELLLDKSKKVGEGVLATADMMKYLPYFIVGGVALYIFSSGRASGHGLGEMFKSAGRRIEKR